MIPTSTNARRANFQPQQHQNQPKEEETEVLPEGKCQITTTATTIGDLLASQTNSYSPSADTSKNPGVTHSADKGDTSKAFTYAQKLYFQMKHSHEAPEKIKSTISTSNPPSRLNFNKSASSFSSSSSLSAQAQPHSFSESKGTTSPSKKPKVERVKSKRCIALVDLDCFFVAVERMLNPSLNGIPVAVGQYTKGSTLIAVSYEAKALGVKRGMFGFQAKKVCPNLRIVQVQTKNEKADLTKYRDASSKVLGIASRFCSKIERASVDEFYLDLTDAVEAEIPNNAYALTGWGQGTLFCDEYDHVSETVPIVAEEDVYLAAGTRLVWKIRQAVKDELGLTCSAGIAENKFLAKSIAGIRKPDTQICLTSSNVQYLCETMPIPKAKSLGGKLGEQLKQVFSIEFLGDLNKIGESKLCEMYGAREGNRLAALAKGLDDTEVEARILPKSIGCSKTFPGLAKLLTRHEVSEWIVKLANELIERLEKDGRRPGTVTIGAYELGTRCTSSFTLENNKFTVASLSSIAETLFDRLIEAKDIEKVGGVQSLSMNLSGFPEETTETAFNTVSFWQCPQCTFENESIWLKCEACGYHKSGMTTSTRSHDTKTPLAGNGTSKSAGGPLLSFLASSSSNNFRPKHAKAIVDEAEVLDDEEEQRNPSKHSTVPTDFSVGIVRNCTAAATSTWTCRRCTFAENDVRFLRCEMCQAFKTL
jgi:nucleotidyltransferase/DNA polymerase involved in DNA repair